MKGYCKDKFRYDQAPVLYKPTIKDIVFGGTYDRVFSKTVTYKISHLRCSDGIILPRSFLELMGTKQRAQALQLFDQGLLVVSICSAITFFSKRNKESTQAKMEHVQGNVSVQYFPQDVVRAESPQKNSSESVAQRKLFVTVADLSDDDRDLIKLPQWQIKALSMCTGQPLTVSVPKWPGNLHFYDAKAIEIVPLSPNYFLLEQTYEETPDIFSELVKEALGRHRVLTEGKTIELLVADKIIKAKVRLIEPSCQQWLINTDAKNLTVSVKITSELERLASYTVTSMDKIKQDNSKLLKQGLDLDAVLSTSGLDFELMEQLEIEHKERLEKVKKGTFKPQHQGSMQGMRLLSPQSPPRIADKGNLLDPYLHMDRVTEESNSPKMSENRRRGNSTNISFAKEVRNSHRISAICVDPPFTNNSQTPMAHSNYPGTFSLFSPTIKINASNRFKNSNQVDAGPMVPSHQAALDRRISAVSQNILHLRDNQLILSKPTADYDGQGGGTTEHNTVILSQFLEPQTRMQKTEKLRDPLLSTFVVPVVHPIALAHQQSIATASIDESSQMQQTQREDRKIFIAQLNESGLKKHRPTQLSMKNLNKRAMSGKNLISLQGGPGEAGPPSKASEASEMIQTPSNPDDGQDSNGQGKFESGDGDVQTGITGHMYQMTPLLRPIMRIDQSSLQKQDTEVAKSQREGISSNCEIRTIQNTEFLDQLNNDGTYGADSDGNILKSSSTVKIARTLRQNKRVIGAQSFKSVNSRSIQDDIQSELISTQKKLRDTQYGGLNKVSSQGLTETSQQPQHHHYVARVTDQINHHPRQPVQFVKTGGHTSALVTNKALLDSQQSVFERLTNSRAYMPSNESTCGGQDEFKRVLNFINQAHPDQYKTYGGTSTAPYQHQIKLCSKKNHHQAPSLHLESALLKLDEQMLDENERTQRARSSHGGRNNKHRSLVSQLRYNDKLLERGVTGSPLPHQCTSTETSFQAALLQHQDFILSSKQAGSLKNTGREQHQQDSSATPFTTLIIKYENDKEMPKSTKQLAQQLSSQQIDPNKMVLSINSSEKMKDLPVVDAVAALRLQCPSPPREYKAVTSRKFKLDQKQQAKSMSQSRGNVSVKAGQMSKLFNQYNRAITIQRNTVDQYATRQLSSETPYLVDPAHLKNRKRHRRRVKTSKLEGNTTTARDLMDSNATPKSFITSPKSNTRRKFMKFQDQTASYSQETTERNINQDSHSPNGHKMALKSLSPRSKDKSDRKSKSMIGGNKRTTRKQHYMNNSPICIKENGSSTASPPQSTSYSIKTKLHLKFEEGNRDSLHVDEDMPTFLPTYSQLKNYEIIPLKRSSPSKLSNEFASSLQGPITTQQFKDSVIDEVNVIDRCQTFETQDQDGTAGHGDRVDSLLNSCQPIQDKRESQVMRSSIDKMMSPKKISIDDRIKPRRRRSSIKRHQYTTEGSIFRGCRREIKKQRTIDAAREAESISALGKANIYSVERDTNNLHSNTGSGTDQNQIVQTIPNLAVDQILIRKKLPEAERSVSELRKSDDQFSTIQHLLMPDSILKNRVTPLSPKNVRVLSKASSKIKWRIVKQKVVSSPGGHKNSNSKHEAAQQVKSQAHLKINQNTLTTKTTALTGRRVKALKTLVASGSQFQTCNAQCFSPRTNLSSNSFLDTSKIVLSHRSNNKSVVAKKASKTTSV